MLCRFWLIAFFVAFLLSACSGKRNGSDDSDGGDTDADTDSDSDSDVDSWCPQTSNSCGEPEALESCGDDNLEAPRLIFPLTGKYVRDRRPQIIWDGASGVSAYRVEIARDRDFTDVVYRSSDFDSYPEMDDRFFHVVSCDLDCGVHFFRVVSVTSQECDTGSESYTWQMYVGMAPYDYDHDGTPDLMCWHVEEGKEEFEKDKIQGYVVYDLHEKGGTDISESDLELAVEFEIEDVFHSLIPRGVGDLNGDNNYDVGLRLVTGEGEDLNIEYLYWGSLNNGNAQDKSSSIVHIDSSNTRRAGESSPGGSFSHFDYNGDGLVDLIMTSSIASTLDKFLLYLGQKQDFSGTIEDLSIEIPVDTEGFYGFFPFSDYNGDGFSEIFAHTVNEDFLIRFGNPDQVSVIDPTEDAVIISSPTEDLYFGDWNIGSDSGAISKWTMGDIDFDGYLELTKVLVDAFNTIDAAGSPVNNVSTGAIALIKDLTSAGNWEFEDVIDTILLGDFDYPMSFEDSYETLTGSIPMGDRNDDLVMDWLVVSSFYNPQGGGRYFINYGGPDLPNEIYASNSDFVGYSGDDAHGNHYFSDIDADGEAEWRSLNDDCSGIGIVLSSSGSEVCIPATLSYCSGRVLLPEDLL